MPTEREFESFVDRQIREAAARGEFDNLPGSGQPLDMGGGYDPDWWAKRFVTRERARLEADRLRQEIRAQLPRLRAKRDSEMTAATLAELESAIAAVNEQLAPQDRIPPITL